MPWGALVTELSLGHCNSAAKQDIIWYIIYLIICISKRQTNCKAISYEFSSGQIGCPCMLLCYDLLPIESRHHWGSVNTWPLTYFSETRGSDSNIIGDKLLSGLESFLKGGLVACFTPGIQMVCYTGYTANSMMICLAIFTRNHKPSIYMSFWEIAFKFYYLRSVQAHQWYARKSWSVVKDPYKSL